MNPTDCLLYLVGQKAINHFVKIITPNDGSDDLVYYPPQSHAVTRFIAGGCWHCRHPSGLNGHSSRLIPVIPSPDLVLQDDGLITQLVYLPHVQEFKPTIHGREREEVILVEAMVSLV